MGEVIVSREPKGFMDRSQTKAFAAALSRFGFRETTPVYNAAEGNFTPFYLVRESPQYNLKISGTIPTLLYIATLAELARTGGDAHTTFDSVPVEVAISFSIAATKGLSLLPVAFDTKAHTVAISSSSSAEQIYSASLWFTDDPHQLMGWATLLHHQISIISAGPVLSGAVDARAMEASISKALDENRTNAHHQGISSYMTNAFDYLQQCYDRAIDGLRQNPTLAQAMDAVVDK
ncbi:hypothetical protein HY988_03935 [Candidatus Micrarchaeota archaeon]|nr:hypothetical protein [Candidatus Micrarchaeota archaeon]